MNIKIFILFALIVTAKHSIFGQKVDSTIYYSGISNNIVVHLTLDKINFQASRISLGTLGKKTAMTLIPINDYLDSTKIFIFYHLNSTYRSKYYFEIDNIRNALYKTPNIVHGTFFKNAKAYKFHLKREY